MDDSSFRQLMFRVLLVALAGVPVVVSCVFLLPKIFQASMPKIAQGVVQHLPEESRADLFEEIVRNVDLFGPELIEISMQNMPEAERQALYDQIASNISSWYEAAPEPGVGRLAKRHSQVEFKGAQVVTNNAGMRNHRDYGPKPRGTFRILCLGDSVVFGEAGLEEDRFCEQMEEFFGAKGLQVDGKTVEAYALGLPSWNMVNEGTYLASRITAYDPDVVIVLTIPNDITDTIGVSGAGLPTQQFTPEYRDRGTAVFSIWPPGFGVSGRSALMTDLSPEGRQRWEKGMRTLKRIEDLQSVRGKATLFSVLRENTYFETIFGEYFRSMGFRSPLIYTSIFRSPETTLPHDPHPNRAGHRILANHYLHALADVGVVQIAPQDLPDLHPGLELSSTPPRPDELEELRRKYAEQKLTQRIVFADLGLRDLGAYLGGFFPEAAGEDGTRRFFASVRSGFLLKKPARGNGRFELEIEVPERAELYPFTLEVSLHGVPVSTLRLETWREAGRHKIVADVPPLAETEVAVEVLLETDSYWTTITDHRMRSFYLVSASID